MYQRGTGILTAPRRLRVAYAGGGYRLQAWVWFPSLTRIFTLMPTPEQWRLDAGRSAGVRPQRIAIDHVSRLLQALGSP